MTQLERSPKIEIISLTDFVELTSSEGEIKLITRSKPVPLVASYITFSKLFGA